MSSTSQVINQANRHRRRRDLVRDMIQVQREGLVIVIGPEDVELIAEDGFIESLREEMCSTQKRS